MRKVFLGLLLGVLLAGAGFYRRSEAQTVTSMQYGVPQASCAVAAGKTTYCFTTDSGLWISLNGAAFAQVQMGPVAAGVTSLNGKTGALTITAVSSAPAVTVGAPPATTAPPTVTVSVN